MFTRNVSRLCEGYLAPPVFFAAEPSRGSNPPPVEGDSPTEGTVEGPLAPQPRPGDITRDAEDDERAGKRSLRDDDIEELKRMERNAEEGRD